MNVTQKLDSNLPSGRLHLLHVVADVAGTLGFPIYMVGGSVRDLLLGRPIRDFDLTVEGDAGNFAEVILKKLGGNILIHSRFGTARWTLTGTTFQRLKVPLLQPEDFPPYLDFVSARSEIYIKPGALPTIKRSTIDDDLRRRDFTINAMAVRLDGEYYGTLIDPLDGRADLKRRAMRVLHPRSFVDDPTRIFRAIRYAVRYGFSIDPETSSLINDESRTVLSQLSGERARHEFDLIFEEENPASMLSMAKDLGLLVEVHPALSMANVERLSYLTSEPEQGFGEYALPEILSFRQTLGWILFLLDMNSSDINTIADRLAFPALLKEAVKDACVLIDELDSYKDRKPSEWTFHLDAVSSLAVHVVWLVTSHESLKKYLQSWQHIKPFINGDDLKSRGLEPGPKYKEILVRLRAAHLDGEITSKEGEEKLLEKLLA